MPPHFQNLGPNLTLWPHATRAEFSLDLPNPEKVKQVSNRELDHHVPISLFQNLKKMDIALSLIP